jgi:hypothetical protein
MSEEPKKMMTFLRTLTPAMAIRTFREKNADPITTGGRLHLKRRRPPRTAMLG